MLDCPVFSDIVARPHHNSVAVDSIRRHDKDSELLQYKRKLSNCSIKEKLKEMTRTGCWKLVLWPSQPAGSVTSRPALAKTRVLVPLEIILSWINLPLNTVEIAAQNSRLDLLIWTEFSELSEYDASRAFADSRPLATFSLREMANLRTCRSSRDVSSICTSASSTPAASWLSNAS